jgi:hypothetical protein
MTDAAKITTGRAAFEKWEALGEDGDTHWNLAHSAALLVCLAEECRGNDWAPQERRATQLLLEAIGKAGQCIVNHCKASERAHAEGE